MAVPKRRHSKARTHKRRGHDFLEPVAQIRCSKCGHAHIPHRICANCGYYRGRNVMHLDLTE